MWRNLQGTDIILSNIQTISKEVFCRFWCSRFLLFTVLCIGLSGTAAGPRARFIVEVVWTDTAFMQVSRITMVIMIITKATDIVIIMMPAIGIRAAAVKHKKTAQTISTIIRTAIFFIRSYQISSSKRPYS